VPLYEYQCNDCGHRFEKIVKFSDAPLRVCPQCGKETVEQLISAPAVQFKGEGWYVTDYARKGSSGSNSGSSDKKVDANASTDSKSDSKSESKSETKSDSKSDSSSSTKSDNTSTTSTTPKKQ
jgi:putative FmdB family regulatory protein